MVKKYLSLSLLSGSSLFLASFATAHNGEDHSHGEPETVAAEVALPAPVEVTASPSELFEAAGIIMGKRMALDQMKVSDDEMAMLVSALGSTSESAMPSPEVMAEFQNLQTAVPARIEAAKTEGSELVALTEAQLKAMAFIVINQSGLPSLVNDPSEMDSFIAGLKKSPSFGEITPETEALMTQLQPFFEERIEKVRAKELEAIAEETKAYVAELEANDAIQKTEAGLYYEIKEEGAGASPTIEDTVLVHYHGTLPDGTVFDSSVDRGEPVTFPMSGVIPGFSSGLAQIKEGGKVKIYVPSELGYGQNPPPGSPIKAGGFIIFDCELIEIKSAESAEG